MAKITRISASDYWNRTWTTENLRYNTLQFKNYYNLFLFIIDKIDYLIHRKCNVYRNIIIQCGPFFVVSKWFDWISDVIVCIHDAGAHIIKNLRITTYCLRLIYILLRNLKLVVIIRVQCLHRYKIIISQTHPPHKRKFCTLISKLNIIKFDF